MRNLNYSDALVDGTEGEMASDDDRPVRLPNGAWVRPSKVHRVCPLAASGSHPDRVAIHSEGGWADVIGCPGEDPKILADRLVSILWPSARNYSVAVVGDQDGGDDAR